jgi:hypothetical protein
VPQPHWTIPVNFRAQDKSVLDAALNIARSEGRDITSIVRTALTEFIKRNGLEHEIRRIDEFLDGSEISKPTYNEVLTPAALKMWTDQDLLNTESICRNAHSNDVGRNPRSNSGIDLPNVYSHRSDKIFFA